MDPPAWTKEGRSEEDLKGDREQGMEDWSPMSELNLAGKWHGPYCNPAYYDMYCFIMICHI